MAPNQLQAIGLLVSGFNCEETAKRVGVCSRTLRRWKNDPEFATELRETFDDLGSTLKARTLAMVNKSLNMSQKSFTALDELLEDGSAATRIRASNTLLTASLRWTRVLNYVGAWYAPPEPEDDEDDDGGDSKNAPPKNPPPSPAFEPSGPEIHGQPVTGTVSAPSASSAPPAADSASAAPPPVAASSPAAPPSASLPAAPATPAPVGAAPTAAENPDKSGHAPQAMPPPQPKPAKPWQKPPHVPFYKSVQRRR